MSKDRLQPSLDREKIGGLIREVRVNGGRVLLEIGPGEVMGIKPEAGDVWVGLDPIFSGVEVGESGGAKTVRADDAGRLPKFVPDLVLAVAPDPNDIEGGLLWDYERFIKGAGMVVVVVDTRTREALSGAGVKGAVAKVIKDLREMGRRVESGEVGETIGVMGRRVDLSLSRDLGSHSKIVYSVR